MYLEVDYFEWALRSSCRARGNLPRPPYCLLLPYTPQHFLFCGTFKTNAISWVSLQSKLSLKPLKLHSIFWVSFCLFKYGHICTNKWEWGRVCGCALGCVLAFCTRIRTIAEIFNFQKNKNDYSLICIVKKYVSVKIYFTSKLKSELENVKIS